MSSTTGAIIADFKEILSEDPNYCFFGGESGTAALWKGVISGGMVLVETVAELGVISMCVGTAGVGCAAGVFMMPGVYFATGAAEAWLYTVVDKKYYWPHNPDIESK